MLQHVDQIVVGIDVMQATGHQQTLDDGCIEDDLIVRHHDLDAGWRARRGTELLKYGVSADEAFRFGLPCGGTLELLLEYTPCLEALSQLCALLDRGRLMRRRVLLGTGEVTLSPAETPTSLEIDETAMAAIFGPSYSMHRTASLRLFSGKRALMASTTSSGPRIECLFL
ncbi:hypothetical protein [Paralcaligenes ureilyticus]|uniref:Uncharacterized protein n=1 Tax=Paralcaligenes ureilyticus TaxID=627131 RepID=A0A4R3M8W4_9BURK|nr:hypothetical protein [Paralcaligenes ureilyticus]TCT09596.1 hypothetical protein EDC26_103215 [Paralcaligenes ureilyticus]